jgi:hypothetical protein
MGWPPLRHPAGKEVHMIGDLTGSRSPSTTHAAADADPDTSAALVMSPYVQFERLITGSARRLYELEDACAQDQLAPPLVERTLIRLGTEEMRALLAQAQVMARAAKVPMTPGLHAAITELGEHAAYIDEQIADLEGQRQMDKLTIRQRRAAHERALAAHTRLLKANALLEVSLARGAHLAADAGELAETRQQWEEEILTASAALVARSQQQLEALRPALTAVSPHADTRLAANGNHSTVAPMSAVPTTNGHSLHTARFAPASTSNGAAPRTVPAAPAPKPLDPALLDAILAPTTASGPLAKKTMPPSPAIKKSKDTKKKGKAASKSHRKR